MMWLDSFAPTNWMPILGLSGAGIATFATVKTEPIFSRKDV